MSTAKNSKCTVDLKQFKYSIPKLSSASIEVLKTFLFLFTLLVIKTI